MSYRRHIQVHYRIATRGVIPVGRTVDIQEEPHGQSAVVLFAPGHCRRRLAEGLTRLSCHQTAHGAWRQRWTTDGRMELPPQGHMVAVARWERVPGRMLPSGRSLAVIEEDGGAVWLVDEDECTRQAQNDMNDLLLRLAGDGLWVQYWIQRRPLSAVGPAPLLTVPGGPLPVA